MSSCCECKGEALARLREKQSRMLKAVLAINAVMFGVELVSGILGRSTALLGDSLDMLGDATVYAVTLYVLDRAPVWRAKASVMKGVVMTLLGLGVLIEAVAKILRPVVPHVGAMGAIGLLALIANGVCLFLLLRHRQDDINMRSAWICSRNDIIANVSVLAAAVVVRASGSWWPDVVVGVGIAALFLTSAFGVLREGVAAWRTEVAPS